MMKIAKKILRFWFEYYGIILSFLFFSGMIYGLSFPWFGIYASSHKATLLPLANHPGYFNTFMAYLFFWAGIFVLLLCGVLAHFLLQGIDKASKWIRFWAYSK